MPKKIDSDFIEFFIWSYMLNHRFVSKNFLVGECLSHFYPDKPDNYKNIKQNLKRKISGLFTDLEKIGAVSQFNTSTIKVNERFKDFKEDVFELMSFKHF